MAKFAELDQAAWSTWVSERPTGIQDLCRRIPPDRLYRLAPTGQRVTILSYGEDGTLRVSVTGQFNAIMFAREVFGINPDDLAECDLPGPDEVLGELLMEETDIKAHIDLIRPAILAGRSGPEPGDEQP